MLVNYKPQGLKVNMRQTVPTFQELSSGKRRWTMSKWGGGRSFHIMVSALEKKIQSDEIDVVDRAVSL